MKGKKSLAGVLLLLVSVAAVALLSVQGVFAVSNYQAVATNGVYLPLMLNAEATTAPTPTATQPAPTATATTVVPTPSATIEPVEGTLIIDHNSVALFDQIPQQYLDAAENIRFTFKDRSVGANINDGISCLAASTWSASLASCRRDYIDSTLTDWKTFTTNDANIPDVILFPGGNDRRNIGFVYAENTWEADVQEFIQQYPSYAGSTDIFTFQHNYLHVGLNSTIDNVYFDPTYNGYNIYDLIALEGQYPSKNFVYWTSSLARTIGTADAQSFNDQMRAWASANGKILLDVAAIESHNPDGSPCRNAQGYEIICRRYTTESDGGHLGSVSGGKIRIAKAIWVLLAQLSGWNP